MGNVSFLSSSKERGNPYKVELSNSINNGTEKHDKAMNKLYYNQ
jgi:hypothetical protein